jgi:rhodanese/phosphatase family protein
MTVLKVDDSLWRGPRPTNLNELVGLGIKRIISLESGIYDVFHPGEPLERQFPCEFGMDQYDLKSSDFRPPERWAVKKFLNLTTVNPKPTFVHCLSGVDRTGFMCAVYRMVVQRWAFERALSEWKALGRHPWYFWWGRELKTWA